MRTIVAAGVLLACSTPASAFTLTSPAFDPGGGIPKAYTCQGVDESPALAWSGAPSDTSSFVLIVEDPDVPDPAAPVRTWVHWVLYDIPASASGLPRNVAPEGLPEGTRRGHNDWKRVGYSGPCPPIGRHRYLFKLYALSETLRDLGPATARQLEEAMKDRIVAEAELIGTYEKAK